MIKVNIICVGKIKEDFYRAAVAEYAKRLSRFCSFEITELPECKSLQEEGQAILRRAQGCIIALCIEGKKLSSIALAAEMKKTVRPRRKNNLHNRLVRGAFARRKGGGEP